MRPLLVATGLLAASTAFAFAPQHAPSPRRLVRRAASTSSSSGTRAPTLGGQLPFNVTELRELALEGLKLTRDVGPTTAATRTLQGLRSGATALSGLTRTVLGERGGESQAVLEALRSGERPAGLSDEALAVALRVFFESMGATYVKLGQFIASSPTLFPAAFVTEMQKCLDDTPPTPWASVRGVIEEELGKPLSSVFSSVDPTPLASASVAQVHCAVLKDTGEEVVLKVRKPGVDATLGADLAFIYVSAKLLELLAPQLGAVSLGDIAGDVRAAMLDELDFRKEAENLLEFTAFANTPEAVGVTAPKLYPEYTSERLLVLERLRGVPLVDLEGLRGRVESPEATLINALNAWTMSVVACPSFHADVHAGNLLVLDDGRVAFIDFGIVGRVSPSTWEAMGALVGGVVAGTAADGSASAVDYEGIATALAQMGATKGECDTASLAADLRAVGEKIAALEPEVMLDGASQSATIAVDDSRITALVLDVVAAAEKNGLRLPREFGLLVKQVLYFDRYTKLLAPGLDLLSDPRIELPTQPGQGGGPLGGAGDVIVDAEVL